MVVGVLTFASCGWPQAGQNAAHTHVQPFEIAIGPTTVAALAPAWSATLGHDDAALGAVSGGVAAATGDDGTLATFDPAGVRRCSGQPVTCAPIWTATVGPDSAPWGATDPAVANGLVYSGSPHGGVYAFDAAGVRNCSGTPRRCAPVWSAFTGLGSSTGSPTVDGSLLFVMTGGGLSAYDALGTSCGPGTCEPVWTAPRPGGALGPSIAGGRIYLSSLDGTLAVFDAAGSEGCAGLPRVCSPLWTATAPQAEAPPVVANGLVYVGGRNGVMAFDAAGSANCQGAPVRCTPVWVAPTGGSVQSSPAVTGDRMFVTAADGRIYAFDAHGRIQCGTTLRVCAPLWKASIGIGGPFVGSPSVANGVVYAAQFSTSAFDAAGERNCSGTPRSCAPLWQGTGGSPVIANGVVYTSGPLPNHTIRAYRIPVA